MTDDATSHTVWHDVLKPRVEGQGWEDVEKPSDRLPARARDVVREEVWNLSRQPVGLSVRFRTDASRIMARWTLDGDPSPDCRKTRLRNGGLDCYGKASDGTWRWVGPGQPTTPPDCEATLNGDRLDGEARAYRVYLPTGVGVSSLAIGVDEGAAFEPMPHDERRPVVVYGTSIVHGATVSRPGMAHTSIISRRLDYPLVNLGFGGNGRMEAEVAGLLAELDAALYVVDCLPNIGADLVPRRLPRLVEAIREARPDVPILFVGDRLYGDASFIPARREANRAKCDAQREAIERLEAGGVAGLHLVESANFFGDDFEGTIDGSHPTDLGSMRMAEALLPKVSSILNAEGVL